MDCTPPHTVMSAYGTRFYHEPQPYTYPFGNTPARDFLEYASSDLEEPSVLVLGCGDIRSCFYTIWKHFSTDFDKRFRGVHFVLNDRSTAVQARNILFIYLCLKLPKDTDSRQKWVRAMWGIWFCHELLPDHESVLRDALKKLLTFSVDLSQWSSTDNPIREIVNFFPSYAISNIRKCWCIWYDQEVNVSVMKMRKDRQKIQTMRLPSLDFEMVRGVYEICGVLGNQLSGGHFETMKQEYRNYLESGNAYCEQIATHSSLTAIERTKSRVNVTFYESKDSPYILHYCSSPFRCFHHRYVYNFEEMRKKGMNVPDYNLSIDDSCFHKFPLLASSFQQFYAWIVGTAQALQNSEKILFTFNSHDAFHFSSSWESEGKCYFDLVFASNVIDSVSPPAFIITSTRMLKENGLFLSATTQYRKLGPTYSDFIEASFGFPSSLLPLVCGIRCINHEGPKYSSCISHQHVPIDIHELEKSAMNIYESIFIWQKVKKTPLCVSSLEMLPEICQALTNSFCISCTRLVNPQGSSRIDYLCTDTSILLLKEFAARLEPSLAKSYEFWAALCANLKAAKDLKPFLTSIQTQATVNNIHLHLLVDTSTCPICKGLPISTYIGQFCVEVGSSRFQDFAMICLKKISHIQYIDCFYQIVSSVSTLKFFFSAPKIFVEKDYNLTFIEYRQGPFGSTSSVLVSGKLNKYQLERPSLTPSTARLTCSLEEPAASSIGIITSHSGSSDSFETKVSLAADKPALLTGTLEVIQLSPSSVEIKCVEDSAVIKYPYPVTKLVVRRSKKDKSLTILASRLHHEYESDGQLFHVNPNDHFSLIPVLSEHDLLKWLVQHQFAPGEWEKFCLNNDLFEYPLIKVKGIIFLLSTLTDDVFFQLHVLDKKKEDGHQNVGIIKVINRVIDIHRKAPALDIYFCFLETVDKQNADLITSQLDEGSSYKVQNFSLNSKAYDLLKEMLFSFHSHTTQCSASFPLVRKPPSLDKCKVHQFFKRAVVYPLYDDRDRAMYYVSQATNFSGLLNHFGQFGAGSDFKYKPQEAATGSKPEPPVNLQYTSVTNCAYCGSSGQTKKCSRCRKVSYCGKECQTKDWKNHKKICKV